MHMLGVIKFQIKEMAANEQKEIVNTNIPYKGGEGSSFFKRNHCRTINKANFE